MTGYNRVDMSMRCDHITVASHNGCWTRRHSAGNEIPVLSFSGLRDPYTAALHAGADLPSAEWVAEDALLIEIPENTTITTPLSLFHTMEAAGICQRISPRVILRVGKHSSVQCIESHEAVRSLHTNCTVEVEEGASLFYIRSDITSAPAVSSSFHAVVKKNGSVTTLYATSAPFCRHDVTIVLAEEGSSATVNGLSALLPYHRSFVRLFIDHRAARTVSSQLFKGLVMDHGFGSFDSRVVLRKEAQQGQGRQQSRFLTLGPSAQTVNKPCFDIHADDVIAAHGATSGVLDDEALFYLMSRGMGASQARQSLIEGFCSDIFTMLPPDMKEAMSARILSMSGDGS